MSREQEASLAPCLTGAPFPSLGPMAGPLGSLRFSFCNCLQSCYGHRTK